MSRARRALRTVALLLGGGGLVGLVLVGGGVLWLRSGSGNAFLRDTLLTQAAPFIPGGTLELAELRTDLFTGVRLEGVALRAPDGRAMVALDGLELRYDLRGLPDKHIIIEELRLERPVVDLRADAGGVIDIVRALGLDGPSEPAPPSDAPWIDVPARVELRSVQIRDGAFAYADQGSPPTALRVEGIGLAGAAEVAGRRADLRGLRLAVGQISGIEGLTIPAPLELAIDGAYVQSDLLIESLSLRAGQSRVRLRGGVKRVDQPGLELDLRLDELHLAEADVEGLAGASPDAPDGVLWGDLDAVGAVKGPLRALEAELDARTPGGAARLTAGVDLEAEPLPWRVELHTAGLDVDRVTPLVPDPLHLDLTVRAKGVGTAPFTDMVADLELEGREQRVAGEVIDQLLIRGQIDHGAVRLDELRARHSVATVVGRGAIELGPDGAPRSLQLDEVRADVPDLRALRRYGVAGLSGRAAWRGRVDAVGLDAGGRLRLDGQLGVERFAAEGAIAVGSVSGPLRADIDLKTQAVDAEGRLEATGIAAEGLDVGRLALDFGAEVRPGGVVRAEAGLEIDALSLGGGAVRVDQIRTADGERVVAGVDASGQPWARGGLMMSELLFGTAGYPAEGGPIRFAFRDPDVPKAAENQQLSIGFALDRQGEDSFFDGEVSGDLLTNTWQIDGLVLAPTEAHPLVAQGPVRFKLADGGARDIEARLESDVGIVDVRGAWLPDATDQTDLSAVFEKVNLAHVAEVFSLFVAPPADGAPSPLAGLDGLASVYLNVKDNTGPMYVDLGVDLKGVAYPGAVKDLTLAATVRGPQTRPAVSARVSGPDGLLSVLSGSVPLAWPEGAPQLDCSAPAALDLIITPGDIRRFTEIAPAAELPEALLSAELQVRGPSCDPDLHLVAAAHVPVEDGGSAVRVDLGVDREAGELRVNGEVAHNLVRLVQLDGRATTRLSEVFQGAFAGGEMPPTDQLSTFASTFDLSLAPLGVDLRGLSGLLDLPAGVRGKVSGGINVSGTPAAPVVQGGLLWLDAGLGGVRLDDAHLLLLPAEGGYALDGRLGFRGAGDVRLAGFVPLRLDLDLGAEQDLQRPGLDLQLSGDGLPLQALQGIVPGVSEAGGRVALTGQVLGTLADPQPQLKLEFADGHLTFKDTGIAYSQLAGAVELTRQSVGIRGLSLRAEPAWAGIGAGGVQQRDGGLTIKGDVALVDDAPTDVNVEVKADQFWLSYTPAYQLRADGRVKVSGAYPALTVKGRVELMDSKVTLGEDFFAESSDLELDPVMAIHRKKGGSAAARAEEAGPDLVSQMVVDLVIDLHRGLRLIADVPLDTSSEATAMLATASVDLQLASPEIKVAMRDGQTSVAAEVGIERGEMTMFGGKFEIAPESTLATTGADFANPVLNLTAVRHTGQYGDVSAIVRGVLDAPELEFKSDDYPDQTDVLSILVVGKPVSELTDSEGQSSAALLASAGSMLAGAAGSSMSRALGASLLSQVEFDGEAVRVGVPLSDRSFLSFERTTAAEEGENVNSVSLEWLITRRVYAEMITGDRGQSSADVYMRWRF